MTNKTGTAMAPMKAIREMIRFEQEAGPPLQFAFGSAIAFKRSEFPVSQSGLRSPLIPGGQASLPVGASRFKSNRVPPLLSGRNA